MTEEDAIEIAREAAEAWGGCDDAPRLVGFRENVVLEVRLRSGCRAALRLHRPGYQSHAAIEGELRWTQALSEAGFSCPRPLATCNGALTHRADDRVVSVIEWLDATPILDVPSVGREMVYRRLGRCLGDLHNLSDRLGGERFGRPSWDRDAFLGAAPLWGPFAANPSLSGAERRFLQVAEDTAGTELVALAEPDIGLIHADALQENVLDDGQTLWLIDFDDCGWGYRGYDLGVALVQHAASPDLPTLSRALLEGYAAVRPGFPKKSLPLFMMLRGFASAGWIVPRAPAGDPRQRSYAERALRLAEIYLGRSAP
ncbi:Ser/Thr protein kinase RdoA (MazF antagonist) [Aliiruegeria haliotis]|uniref:Ser/Thr protein kinase RdoA (MazF antagonist) n=1 Tax=Aliiruegeria haliotis TaxID=1280846 RepID=A0A2T0RJ25_9RHOB|nr:phosphotransferase [Aliiruegeria haliotis]PRY21204.1 Ser/Thr protein kinase RdoA (MazF antagonist) [Aliiruegeria haliotis]